MSKFDVMLIFVFSIIAVIIGMSFYQTVYGLEQFGAGFWTFITAVCGGEIVTFSLYRITKEKYERKAEKIAKHAAKDGKTVNVNVDTSRIAPASTVASEPIIMEAEEAIKKPTIEISMDDIIKPASTENVKPLSAEKAKPLSTEKIKPMTSVSDLKSLNPKEKKGE